MSQPCAIFRSRFAIKSISVKEGGRDWLTTASLRLLCFFEVIDFVLVILIEATRLLRSPKKLSSTYDTADNGEARPGLNSYTFVL